MNITEQKALEIAKERGLVPQDYQIPKPELSPQDALKMAINRGLIKPREDGAGFLVRSKFSFADTDKGRKQVLEDSFGKGNAYKIGDRWLVKDNKGWNYVDEEGLSWNDFADLVGDTPEMLGASAGMFAGSGLGSIPLAASGAAGGRSVKKLIAKALEIEDNQSVGDIVEDLGTSAAFAGVGQGVGVALAKGLSKIAAPFANKMTPDAIARRDLANKYGIQLTPADIVQSPTLSRLENVLNSGLTGGKIADVKNKQFGDLQKHLTSTIDDITKGKTDEEIGMDFIKSLDNSLRANKQAFNNRYGDIAKQIDKPIDINNLKSTASEIIAKNSKVPESLRGQSLVTANEIASMGDDVLDYGTLSMIRTNLGDKAYKGDKVTGDIGTAQFKQLRKALDKDYDTYANVNGLGGIKKAIDKDFSLYKKQYEEGIVNKVLKDQNKGSIIPEKIGNNATSTITNAKRVSDALDGSKELLEQSIGSRLKNHSFTSNASIDTPFSNFYSTDKLNTVINKNKDVYDFAVSEANKEKLGDLVKLGFDTGLSKKAYGNPSGTAKVLDGIANTGIMYFDPVIGASALAGRFLGSKAYTSELGRKYLTEGFKIPMTSKYMGATGATLGSFSRPQKVMGNTGAKTGLYYEHNRKEH